MIIIQLYGLYALFLLNFYVFKHKRFQEYLLKELRFYLFPIQGQCQQSGNCCRGIMLFYDGEAVNTLKKYDLLSKEFSKDRRFIPRYPSSVTKQSSDIESYDCSKLSSQNHCLSYDDRPSLCRQYPWSYFYDHGQLKPNCGYFVTFRDIYFPVIPTVLKKNITNTQQKMDLA